MHAKKNNEKAFPCLSRRHGILILQCACICLQCMNFARRTFSGNKATILQVGIGRRIADKRIFFAVQCIFRGNKLH